LAAQSVLQVVAVAQTYPPQVEAVGTWQWLLPSQAAAGRNIADAQLAPLHAVPAT